MTLDRKLVAALNKRFEKYQLVYPNAVCTFMDPRYMRIFFDEIQLASIIKNLKDFHKEIVSAIAADAQLTRASAQDEGLEAESTSSVAHLSGVSDDRMPALAPLSGSGSKSISNSVDLLWVISIKELLQADL